jgi:hypothetical protein
MSQLNDYEQRLKADMGSVIYHYLLGKKKWQRLAPGIEQRSDRESIFSTIKREWIESPNNTIGIGETRCLWLHHSLLASNPRLFQLYFYALLFGKNSSKKLKSHMLEYRSVLPNECELKPKFRWFGEQTQVPSLERIQENLLNNFKLNPNKIADLFHPKLGKFVTFIDEIAAEISNKNISFTPELFNAESRKHLEALAGFQGIRVIDPNPEEVEPDSDLIFNP